MFKIMDKTIETSQESMAKGKKSIDKLLNRKDLGFFALPERKNLWSSAQEQGQILAKKYKRMVVIGIGGSSLGGLVIKEVLMRANPKFQERELLFFENVDAFDFWHNLKSLDQLETTCWVVVSKSGGTIETLANANFVSQYLKTRGIEFAKHCQVVSEHRDNPLTEWARENKIPILEIPVDVGGRFSVLTPVGTLPAAFLGADLEEMRKGAEQILQNKDLVAELVAQSLQSFKRDEWITVFWSYCSSLRWFGGWIQQLWAESLAKKTDNYGKPGPRVSSPIACVGANDQHSILQQVGEGYHDKFVWFLRVKESENFGETLKHSIFTNQKILEGKGMGELLAAEAQATANALKQQGVHSLTLGVEKLDEKTLGGLFMLFELVVGAMGEALEINAFDQPGVELGKRLAKDILVKSGL